MARKSGPALYELLGKSKGVGAPTGGSVSKAPPRQAIFRSGEGQAIGLIAVAVAAVVIAYFVGVSRGERLGRAALVAEQEAQAAASAQSAVSAISAAATRLAGQLETTARPAGAGVGTPTSDTPSGGARAVRESENRGGSGGNGFAAGELGAPTPLPPLQGDADPRQPGLNYFVLATVAETNARMIAEYCRSQGLDAHVVKGNNGRFFEVIVLPGFPAAERSGPVVKELEARIRRAGVRYKAESRQNPDFGDMYHKLYRP
jgi:hypothetical protein